MIDTFIWIICLMLIYWLGYNIGVEDATIEDHIQMETNLKDKFVQVLNKASTVIKGTRWN